MRQIIRTYWPYAALTLLVLGPLLAPGYILALDAVFTPVLRMPATVGNDYLWLGMLHAFNLIIPSQIIEKLLFAGILLGSGIGMHRFAIWMAWHTAKAQRAMSWRLAAYLAGIVYMINPYTYDRFMAGQYGVLLGYALLPWFATACWKFALAPRRQSLLAPLFLALAASIMSIPTLAELLIIAVSVLLAAWWRRPALARRGSPLLAAGLAFFLFMGSYWLLPLVMGKGSLSATVSQFDSAHTAAFATLGRNIITKCIHVLRLQGFWAEAHQLFILPGDRLPLWGLVQLLMWALIGVGVVTLARRAKRFAVATIGAGIAGLVLAIGVLPLTALGYREPQKFAGLVAFAFAVCVLYGAARLLGRTGERSETNQALLLIAGAVIVLVWTPTMYWGFGGQLRAAQYPAGWYAINRQLDQDHTSFSVLALPWHEYMSFSFAGRIIAHPARAGFFDKPVIVSANPELGAIKPPMDNTPEAALATIMQHAPSENFAAQLAQHNVKYILLFKDYDYHRYGYLDTQAGILMEQDTPSLTLYCNQVWKERP